MEEIRAEGFFENPADTFLERFEKRWKRLQAARPRHFCPRASLSRFQRSPAYPKAILPICSALRLRSATMPSW
jgi:hypothetical protein